MKHKLTLVGLVCVLALPAAADHLGIVEILPAQPREGDSVTLRVGSVTICFEPTSVTRVGNHFVLDFPGCPATGISAVDVSLGPLPPGIYTYEIQVVGEPLLAPDNPGSFAVLSTATVPTLTPASLAALAFLVAVAGAWMMARQT
ncbi:MAG TPA: hypothetical protein VF432_17800 [Thermoanaerobaculia bacterium]